MTTVAHRSSPIAEMLEWLETGTGLGRRGLGLTPNLRVEDYVEDGDYVLKAEMPGVDPEKDVDVSIDGGIITIRGERKEEQKEKNHQELHYGSFTRSIPLPRGVKPDQITAKYADGVLEVRVPMGAEETAAVKVPVQRPS
jgi:HSP20 family molecular chaperone IbpA